MLLNEILKITAKIPYWCCTTTQIWVVQPSDWLKNWLYSDRSTTHMWRITSVEFLHLFLRHHFTGEQEVVLQNIFSGWEWVCCWLFSLLWRRNFIIRVIYSHLCTANCIKSSTQHYFKPNWWIPLKTLLFLSENKAQMGMQIFVTV